MLVLAGAIVFSSFPAATAWAAEKNEIDRPLVFVSIAPQKYFARQIGGEMINVRIMVPSGASPATYGPKPKQMAELSRAKIYFSIGVPFEKAWLEKISASNPGMSIIDTAKGIEKIPMKALRHGEEKKCGPRGRHNGRGMPDPHIWTSPPLVMKQARVMLKALQKIDPLRASFYGENYRKFIALLEDLDSDLREIFAGKHGMRFMVFHPSWGYFARSYGLKQIPVEIEGKSPKPSQLMKLIRDAINYDIKVIFAQPQFSSKAAGQIAKEIGGKVVFADPLAGNWLENMRGIGSKFNEAIR